MNNLLTIDGAHGEGGGQILRSALALSLLTRTPFRLLNIRAGRTRPGLMRQHLTAVQAAVAVGAAQAEGAFVGSRELVFRPADMRSGDYEFAVGTAGSATLVLQTVLPALLTASGPSTLVLEGGTHNPHAPPFDFLQRAFLPLLGRMGARVTVSLEHYGFYPAGGGRLNVWIDPVDRLQPLELLERGEACGRTVRALVAHLPMSIARREVDIVRSRFPWPEDCFHVEEVRNSRGPGNVLIVDLAFEHVHEVVTGFGEQGVLAEHVAVHTTKAVRQYLASPAPVGVHLADQLLLPLAVAGGGAFRTLPLSRHALTNIDIIQQFLPVAIRVQPEEGGCTVVIE